MANLTQIQVGGVDYNITDPNALTDVQLNSVSVKSGTVANIPAASQSANGYMSTTNQSFSGEKTFSAIKCGSSSVYGALSASGIRVPSVSYGTSDPSGTPSTGAGTLYFKIVE